MWSIGTVLVGHAITRFPIENSERMHHVREKGNSMATPDLARSGSRAEMLGTSPFYFHTPHQTRALRKCSTFSFDFAFFATMDFFPQSKPCSGSFSALFARAVNFLRCISRSADFFGAGEVGSLGSEGNFAQPPMNKPYRDRVPDATEGKKTVHFLVFVRRLNCFGKSDSV